jgi:outer membrane lipoprotein-sorting protein
MNKGEALMFKRVLTAFLVMGAVAAAQTADEIIAKNIAARGGIAKLHAISTMKTTAITSSPHGEVPVTIYKKRPNLYRNEITFQGLTGIQAYDGTTGWTIMPFRGKTDPELVPAEQLRSMQLQADINGSLVDYREKGSKVEYLGKESVEGTETYKLKVTLQNGVEQKLFIDTETNLVIKSRTRDLVRGTESVTESTFGDYKEINGITIPFSIETGAPGAPQKSKVTIQKVKINIPIDSAIFKMTVSK